jgi:hypothetical protein
MMSSEFNPKPAKFDLTRSYDEDFQSG